MNIINAVDGLSGIQKIGLNRELQQTSSQRMLDRLELLKGLKGKEGITKAAQGFESLFLYKMLEVMRKTIPKNSLFGDSFGLDIFYSMLDEKVANRIAESQQLGLSDLIIKHLNKKYNVNREDETKKIGAGAEPLHQAKPRGKTGREKMRIDEQVNRYLPIINEAAAHYGLDPDLLKAVIAQESRGDSRAVSRSGAKGLMQLMDSTAVELNVKNVFDPKENIFGGARYLKQLLVDNKGDLMRALASYNAGPGAVKLFDGVPPYSETHTYIQRISKLQKQFRRGESI